MADHAVATGSSGMPNSVSEAMLMLEALGKEKKALESREKALKAFMQQQIPLALNEEQKLVGVNDGVRLLMSTRSSLKYTKALDAVKERLVAKTRWGDFDAIIEEFTSYFDVAMFSWVKED